MRMTQHCETRCIQRKISSNDIEMTLQFGITTLDKRVLGVKSCLALLNAIDKWTKELENAKTNNEFNLQELRS